jgi:eukaryotic-like serine/threonine-protein kinase
MDAVLYHAETSERRALILALGTYGADGLSPGEREALVGRLLDLYRSDPDAGIHGAAEWTLRQWKQQEKLKELDAGLTKLKDWGERRWYLNRQGQTYAVIDGPVEFSMGAPPTEPDRVPGNEPPWRMRIPRRFAIATKEVTVEQFQRFLKLRGMTSDRDQLPPGVRSRFSPDPEGPWIGPDWYKAAHYCNWLSEQEGLPKEEWCYVPAEGGYADGMTVPADVLERTGYRLPTEAEWEYACRSGTVTCRYYGASTELLGFYARYQDNSRGHAWGCGGLLPNDLGLFDMLGNASEWVHDRVGVTMDPAARWPGRHGIFNDSINTKEVVSGKTFRYLRGGAYGVQPAVIRSTFRTYGAPFRHNAGDGFRPARTLH